MLIHTTAFMLAHMSSISNAKRGPIAIGGLISFISHALHLKADLATLVPVLGSTFLDLHAFQSQKLIKHKRNDKYYSVINNKVVKSVILPFHAGTNVQVTGNWLYDLEADEDAEAILMDTGAGGDGDTDEKLD